MVMIVMSQPCVGALSPSELWNSEHLQNNNEGMQKKWTKEVELLFSATLEYKTKERWANGAMGHILLILYSTSVPSAIL